MPTFNVKIRVRVRKGYSEFSIINVMVDSADKPDVTVDEVESATIRYKEG